jgi:hypothetical protein
VTGFCEHCNETSAYFFIFMCIPCIFIVYYLLLPTTLHTYIEILKYYYKTLLHVSVLLHYLQAPLILRLLKLSKIKIIKITKKKKKIVV